MYTLWYRWPFIIWHRLFGHPPEYVSEPAFGIVANVCSCGKITRSKQGEG